MMYLKLKEDCKKWALVPLSKGEVLVYCDVCNSYQAVDSIAGAVAISEDQWAAGLCSDVYAYAGYSILSSSYESGIENGTAFMKARAYVLNLNGYAQLTDYIKAQGEAKVVYG